MLRWVILGALFAACGSSTQESSSAAQGDSGPEAGGVPTCSGAPPALSIEGTVGGKPFQAASARTSGDPALLTIWLVDYADACGVDGYKASSRLVEVDATVPKTDPCAPFGAAATYAILDSNCGVADRQAATGTLQLTTLSSTVVAGSVDLAFGNGDHVSGTFNAPVCPFGQFGCEP